MNRKGSRAASLSTKPKKLVRPPLASAAMSSLGGGGSGFTAFRSGGACVSFGPGPPGSGATLGVDVPNAHAVAVPFELPDRRRVGPFSDDEQANAGPLRIIEIGRLGAA